MGHWILLLFYTWRNDNFKSLFWLGFSHILALKNWIQLCWDFKAVWHSKNSRYFGRIFRLLKTNYWSTIETSFTHFDTKNCPYFVLWIDYSLARIFTNFGTKNYRIFTVRTDLSPPGISKHFDTKNCRIYWLNRTVWSADILSFELTKVWPGFSQILTRRITRFLLFEITGI